MPRPRKSAAVHPADVVGYSRLAVDATTGVTDIVEALHSNIDRGPTGDIASLVYASVRGVTTLVGGAIDVLLAPVVPVLNAGPSSPEREAILAALNGAIGDYLTATANPLAISMSLSQDGLAAIPRPSGKLVVLLHGLCMNNLHWTRNGHNHGAALAADLGYTPGYLHYNSGLHISANGRAFADLMESLVMQWPLPLKELAIVGHSMGGLVARSACHYGALAGHGWTRLLRKLVFLGTPHHGAPLERVANFVNTILDLNLYTAPFARLGKIRSAGITDLRYGNVLEEDWEGRDRFEHSTDRRRPVPLPEGVDCYAIAAKDGRLADGFVPVNSALGSHTEPHRCLAFAESHQWIGQNMNHFDLLSETAVYEKIREWVAS